VDRRREEAAGEFGEELKPLCWKIRDRFTARQDHCAAGGKIAMADVTTQKKNFKLSPIPTKGIFPSLFISNNSALLS
jgi:hypothetical protein